MMTAREAILSYIDHLMDWDYVRTLLAAVEMPVLLCEIAAIVDGDEHDVAAYALCFVRDLGISSPKDIRSLFWTELGISPLCLALEHAITSDNRHKRVQSIYTVAKIGLTQFLPTLYTAFGMFHHRDPLLIPSLISEIRWLGGNEWSLFDRMVASDGYLTRWALLEALDSGIYRSPDAGERLTRTKQYILPLLRDETILVSQEAAYHFAEIEFYERFTALSRQEQKAGRRSVEQIKPALDFALLRIRFYQHLSTQKKDDYTLQELEEFTVELAATRNA